jgi:hypothetical protein
MLSMLDDDASHSLAHSQRDGQKLSKTKERESRGNEIMVVNRRDGDDG